MVLIWGIQKKARKGQEAMIEKASRYIESLDAREIVMVPTVALSEYLTGYLDKADREEQQAIISRRFFVAGFDAPAAASAAEIMVSTAANSMKGVGERRLVKADAQIIGTAIQHGASIIITGNKEEFEKLAGGKIEVSDIPEVHIQQPLELSPPEIKEAQQDEQQQPPSKPN